MLGCLVMQDGIGQGWLGLGEKKGGTSIKQIFIVDHNNYPIFIAVVIHVPTIIVYCNNCSELAVI